MLGDVIELSVVVTDLETAIKDFETLFDLKVHSRGESKEFGFINAILPLGKGHIELLQPTDPSSAVAKFLKAHGEGVYLVGFEVNDVSNSVQKLRQRGAKVTEKVPQDKPDKGIAWVYPKNTHGVFVELRHPEKYT